ncbi:adenylate/guanylate cyclase domain-containing protein [Desulfovibrio mangrovi]|uniref:CHASE2 domain-containing protein n=1 Tax=Desulfovibrio mangrovi TaxID=2976983 RepID=UPI0022481BD1|nr:adenylate/guanylate cyclase domain-containing protein [Desulfovibrio mangrovi]UZP68288.1 adenylate/guanylate cyclase domain-containing protein [Desulfovibrio mangrovi]
MRLGFRRLRLWLKTQLGGRIAVLMTGVCITALMLLFYLWNPFSLRGLVYKVYDELLIQTHTRETTGVPIIIDIDEKSLEKFGQWPWPRYRVAMLLALAQRYGAAAVGLDIVFSEPDRTSPRILKERLAEDLKVRMNISGLPDALLDNDVLLAENLRHGPFVLGYHFNFESSGSNEKACTLHPVKPVILSSAGAAAPEDVLYNAPEAICNLQVLGEAAPSSGFFTTVPDIDGMLRRTPLIIYFKGNIYPSLALAMLMQASGNSQITLKMKEGGVESIKFADMVIPLDERGRMLLKYRGKGGTFDYISAADILEQKLKPNALKGRLVLIGTSAAGLKDLRAQPFDPVFPGVEAHATVLDTILAGDFITRPWYARALEFNAILLVGLISTIILSLTGAMPALVACIIMGAGLLFGAKWSFATHGFFLSPLTAMFTLILNFSLLTLMKFRREEGHKKFLTATFKSYLSPELIEEMIAERTMPELGGEARIMTAYFTDIQKFSTFSEILTAPQLVELLNEYLSAMTDILIADGGTLDKYEGDAIIAFFGAPLDLPDHTLRACKVALAMQNSLLALRRKWLAETYDPTVEDRNTKRYPPEVWPHGSKWPVNVHNMCMRIGINSGEMVVGNMGSAIRMNYTMMGDPVNLAARLEAGAKQFGIYTAVSGHTLDVSFKDTRGGMVTVRDYVETRFIDRIAVVGKSEPVEVYELVALKGELSETEHSLFDLFASGITLYQAQQWDKAIAAFTEAKAYERFPDAQTTPSDVFIKRCLQYRENPPVPTGEPWDGVYRMTSK